MPGKAVDMDAKYHQESIWYFVSPLYSEIRLVKKFMVNLEIKVQFMESNHLLNWFSSGYKRSVYSWK